MLTLDTTDKSIVAVLTYSHYTTAPEYVSGYADDNGTTTFTEGSADGVFTGETEITLVAAPSSGNRRLVRSLIITNRDNKPAKVQVSLADSSSRYVLCNPTLDPDEALIFHSDLGFRTINWEGGTKMVREGAAPKPGPDIQVFTSSGTWRKPSNGNAKSVFAFVLGGGGGGAGGGRTSTASTVRGGAGGAGACASFMWMDASVVGSTETVTVGAGGAGGAAITGTSANGNDGTPGGLSSFGSRLRADGGINGGGGSLPSQNVIGMAIGAHGVLDGVSPVNGNDCTKPINQTFVSAGTIGAAAGGGAGGRRVITTGARVNGGDGGLASGATVRAAGGIAADPNGGNGDSGGSVYNYSSGWTGGSGGAGGGAGNAGTGGRGGDGVLGSGGGGGGAVNSTGASNPSGAGGTGGDGVVVVITRF